ncbi:MAG TPA: GTPase ObgE [Patescibacteria group bacterium]
MFHDEVSLSLESGKGGDGAVSFRREKYIPKGGPDGGDGGRGGSVFIEVNTQLTDLNHLASVRELKAESGVPGAGKKLFGRKGEDLTVFVPRGTRVYRQAGTAWRLVADMTEADSRKRVLKGGNGGLGNVHFATATHQTPRYAQPGEPAERAVFKFELQLIADVGIIGLPNAGKSTFLSIVSDAQPKIGNYPFTTLSPVLGVVPYREKRFVFADIPGLIEGASEGKGLGHQFLRHVKRTKTLVHFIESLSDDYARDYSTVRNELEKFDSGLAQKSEIVVITKSELITDDIAEETQVKIEALKACLSQSSHLFSRHTISAVSRENIKELLAEIGEQLSEE